MTRHLLLPAFLASFGLLAACQSKPTELPAATQAGPKIAAPPVAQAAKATPPMVAGLVGTYRQATDSTDCDCDLAVIIWRTGRQLHYRIADYPEQGLVTADSAADRPGLGFVSAPKPHEEAHEWSGSLEGDTLMVQTYGNSMNEYENFVGGCGCKFLTLVKQR